MYIVKNISHPPDNQDKAHGRIRLTREELCSGKPGEKGSISLHFDCNLDKGTRYLKHQAQRKCPKALKARQGCNIQSGFQCTECWWYLVTLSIIVGTWQGCHTQ